MHLSPKAHLVGLFLVALTSFVSACSDRTEPVATVQHVGFASRIERNLRHLSEPTEPPPRAPAPIRLRAPSSDGTVNPLARECVGSVLALDARAERVPLGFLRLRKV